MDNNHKLKTELESVLFNLKLLCMLPDDHVIVCDISDDFNFEKMDISDLGSFVNIIYFCENACWDAFPKSFDGIWTSIYQCLKTLYTIRIPKLIGTLENDDIKELFDFLGESCRGMIKMRNIFNSLDNIDDDLRQYIWSMDIDSVKKIVKISWF